MNTYIGIDLGTSALKLLLVDEGGRVLARARESYEVYSDEPFASEQDPADWEEALWNGLEGLLDNQDPSSVKAVSFSGQMHGVVSLDEQYRPLGKAWLWNDGRAKDVSAKINERDHDLLVKETGNISYPGFSLPKIIHHRKIDPEWWGQVRHILLPKDYLSFLLTHRLGSEYSDASGTLLFNPRTKTYSRPLMKLFKLDADLFPPLYPSTYCLGYVKEDVAARFGFNDDVKVIMGAADNVAAAIGIGVVKEKMVGISLGTSGTVFSPVGRMPTHNDSMHVFAFPSPSYLHLGCMLSSASCLAWWAELTKEKDIAALLDSLEPLLGHNEVYFLPYLNGERCPHNDPEASGMFMGLRMQNDAKDMAFAVIEGVCFGIREMIEAGKLTSSLPFILTGGGAKSPLWAKLLATVLDHDLAIPDIDEGPSYGAAVLAISGVSGEAVASIAKRLNKERTLVKPIDSLVSYYRKRYQRYLKLYPLTKQFES